MYYQFNHTAAQNCYENAMSNTGQIQSTENNILIFLSEGGNQHLRKVNCLRHFEDSSCPRLPSDIALCMAILPSYEYTYLRLFGRITTHSINDKLPQNS